MSKYELWYKQITDRGQQRKLEQPYEKHHIIPKCFGGDNTKSNITILTAREHFVCHWLLTKIYKDGEKHWQMLNAIRIMRAENANQRRYNTKITSRVYAKLKEEYTILQREKVSGPNNGMFGRKQTEEARRKISEANSGDKNPAKRPEVAEKISTTMLGRTREAFSEEWKQKMSLAKKDKPQRICSCVICKREISVSNIKQHYKWSHP